MTETGGGCYRKLRFVAAGKPSFDVTLILTPDQKFLVSELNDITVDPILEEKRQEAERRHDLEKDDGRPSLGASTAPVTIVVFSDFQCPYCGRFAETMKQIASEEKRVRFIFRNLPLDMHPWAKAAAETAACVQKQDREAFWRVHDFLFEHQRELTAENLQARLMAFLGTARGVRLAQVKECVDRHSTASRIRSDLALAAANKIRGTPAVFVNGRLVAGGAPTREHLLTLVRENLNEVGRIERHQRVGNGAK